MPILALTTGAIWDRVRDRYNHRFSDVEQLGGFMTNVLRVARVKYGSGQARLKSRVGKNLPVDPHHGAAACHWVMVRLDTQFRVGGAGMDKLAHV